MIFSSVPFLCFFLAAMLVLYYALPGKLKTAVLLVFSLLFYAWEKPVYALVLVGVGTVGYFLGLLADKTGKRKLFLVLAVALNVGVLAFFKIAGSKFGFGTPPGLSFFIFSSVAYSVDIYRNPSKTERNYFYYLCYITMFPKLLSGPIVRYDEVKDRLHEPMVELSDVWEGGFRFLLGLFKKVLLADALGRLFAELTAESALTMAGTWMAILAYSLELYIDFSSYSDMALGLGRMMGFTFKENFNYPYTAGSITDFWRRWHISLSSFFKDYVYIPLGGNRKGVTRTILNLFAVWLLTGLWHGISLNFILWGLYYGLLLVLEKFVLNKWLDRWPKWLRHGTTMLFVLFGWCLFAFSDLGRLGTFLSGFGRFDALADVTDWYNLKNYGVELLVGLLVSAPGISTWIFAKKKTFGTILVTVMMLLLLAATVGSLMRDSFSPFLYFNF